jgi:hypothetical protein
MFLGLGQVYYWRFQSNTHNTYNYIIKTKWSYVERIDLSSLGREHVMLNVVAADLSCRHKSDDFNSFLMHLFFWKLTKQKNIVRCGLPSRK